MDRIVMTVDDLHRLLAWRDDHKEEVRSNPNPLKAIEIIAPHNGYHIKGIREGGKLTLYLSRDGKSLGKCSFRQSGPSWIATKNQMDVSEEDLQSVLTVYCSLMALMAYGAVQYLALDEDAGDREEVPHKTAKKAARKPRNRTTYIIRTVKGCLQAMPSGSHAKPRGVFTVRGHYRRYRSGKVVWIAEYKKGTGKTRGKSYKLGGKANGEIKKETV